MRTGKKIDVALIIGLAIPVLMIVLVAAAIYMPRFLADIEDPQVDFLYSVGYTNRYRYFVEDGRLQLEERESECEAQNSRGKEKIQFFIHRVRENTGERVSFEEASMLRLDDTALSPDGYELAYGRRSEFLFPMWSSRDYRTRYLRKERRAIRLELEIGESFDYATNMTFLGWIEE